MKWFKRQEPDLQSPNFINNPKILLVPSDLKTYLGAYESITDEALNFQVFESDSILSYKVSYDYLTRHKITIERRLGSLPLPANEEVGMVNILRLTKGIFSLVLINSKNWKKVVDGDANKTEDSLCVLGRCELRKYDFDDLKEILEIRVERMLPFRTIATIFE